MSDIPNLTEAEFNTLMQCTNSTEWNATCDTIKRARGGIYPNDWYHRMIASGVIHLITSTFTDR